MKVLVIGLSGESVFLNVDHFNNIGETIHTKNRFVEPGGKGYNQAIGLGRLGVDVSFISIVGNDSYSKTIKDVLVENNVKPLLIKKDSLSDYAVIVTDKTGENHVIVDSSLSSTITFSDILMFDKEIQECDIILLQNEYPKDVLYSIIDYYYKLGKTIVLNPAPRLELNEEYIKKIDYIIPNEFELTSLAKDHVYETLYNKGLKHIICTRGSKDVCYYNGSYHYFEVEKVNVVDTTGAGDSFCSGIVYGIANNMDIFDTIRFAIKVSAYKITKKGAISGLPYLADIKE